MPPEPPAFRSGNTLTTTFTGTRTERHGMPVERIPTPDRLLAWLDLQGLSVVSCSEEELRHAQDLREAIHAAATAVATDQALPLADVRALNDACSRGSASAALEPSGHRSWRLGPPPAVQDALRVVATDAVALVSGEQAGRLALCASPTCRAVFLDTSQSGTRRWCDMNSCGNRQKKARVRAKQKGSAAGS